MPPLNANLFGGWEVWGVWVCLPIIFYNSTFRKTENHCTKLSEINSQHSITIDTRTSQKEKIKKCCG